MIDPKLIFGRLGNSLFQYAYIYAQMKDGTIPDIFLQDPAYFEKYEREIKELFGQNIGYTDAVALHVRRGDYVDNPFYVDLSQTDYYQKAIREFPVDKYLVFSDDIAYCKDIWGTDLRFEFVERSNEVEDLNLMASCKSQIIANSSYSWWAAYLNPNKDKKIIYPNKWFQDNVQRVKFPQSWKAL